MRCLSMINHLLASISLFLVLAGSSTGFANGTGQTSLSVTLEDGTLRIVGNKTGDNIFVLEYEGWIFVSENLANPFLVFDCFPASDVVNVSIVSAGGDDRIKFGGTFGGHFSIDSGPGNDWIETTFKQPFSLIPGDLDLNTGLDDDVVSLHDLVITGDTRISTGHGRDDINLIGDISFSGDVSINTGTHDDNCYVWGVDAEGVPTHHIFGNLEVQMGQGNDFFSGVAWYEPFFGPDLIVDGFALFVGGQGFDTFIDPSTLTIDPLNLEIVGFESE